MRASGGCLTQLGCAFKQILTLRWNSGSWSASWASNPAAAAASSPTIERRCQPWSRITVRSHHVVVPVHAPRLIKAGVRVGGDSPASGCMLARSRRAWSRCGRLSSSCLELPVSIGNRGGRAVGLWSASVTAIESSRMRSTAPTLARIRVATASGSASTPSRRCSVPMKACQ